MYAVDERALRRQLQAPRPDVVERPRREPAADALALELVEHLGVGEHEPRVMRLVLGEPGERPVDPRLVAVLGRVVPDVDGGFHA